MFSDAFTGTLVPEDSAAAANTWSDNHSSYKFAAFSRTPVHRSHSLCIPSGTKIKFLVYSISYVVLTFLLICRSTVCLAIYFSPIVTGLRVLVSEKLWDPYRFRFNLKTPVELTWAPKSRQDWQKHNFIHNKVFRIHKPAICLPYAGLENLGQHLLLRN